MPIKRHHAFAYDFILRFHDTLLKPYETDHAKLDTFLKEHYMTDFKKTMDTVKGADWILQHCRRYTLQPSVLTAELKALFNFYGKQIDIHTGEPLFNAEAWQKAANIIEEARQGHLSDPPGLQLYILTGEFCWILSIIFSPHPSTGHDTHGLPIYKCLRGTNC